MLNNLDKHGPCSLLSVPCLDPTPTRLARNVDMFLLCNVFNLYPFAFFFFFFQLCTPYQESTCHASERPAFDGEKIQSLKN